MPLIFIKRDIKRYFEEEGLKQHLPYGFGNEIVIRLTKTAGGKYTLKNQIKRYRERFRLFIDEFTTEELNTLKRAINANESHSIIDRAIEWINEVEFYLTSRAETMNEQWMNNDEPRVNREKTHQQHLKHPKYQKYFKDLELDTVKNDPAKIDMEEFNALEEEFERMVGEWK